MIKWYEKAGCNDDIVLSSRIRLARNFSNYLFPPRISEEDSMKMINEVYDSFKEEYEDSFKCIFMKDCSEDKKNALKERRMVNSKMAKVVNGAVIVSEDEGTLVMLNADDHVRIQVLANGMNLKDCFIAASGIDDYIDSRFEYAFDEQYGYRTTYPTNLGTGLRAGYTLHLPALAEVKRISVISEELGRFGMKLKTVYGNGETGYGNIYQISNQKTLGQDEQEIISDLNDVAIQIIGQEKEQRKYLYENNRIKMEDQIYKSYGVLKYARKISLSDAMTLLSEFIMGISMGIISIDKDQGFSINRMIMEIQPAVINNSSPKALSVDETDVLRAEYIRNNLPKLI